MNFPSRHPLNQSFRRSILSQADLILAMEVNDIWGTLSDFHDRIVRTSEPRYKKTAKIVTLGTRGLYMKANYQDLGRYQEVDLDISGDAEASLPALTEQVKRRIDEGRKAAFDARGKKLAAAKLATVEQAKLDATIGWDASPITTARLCAELYSQIKDEDWSLVGTSIGTGMAASPVGFQEALSMERRRRRRWCRLHLAGLVGCCARQQAAWTIDGGDRRRRRFHVRAVDAVDRRASPDPAALHRAQQPRLSSGIHVPAGDGRAPWPRHHATPISAPRSRIPSSITRRSPRGSASMARARSTTRASLRRR